MYEIEEAITFILKSALKKLAGAFLHYSTITIQNREGIMIFSKWLM